MSSAEGQSSLRTLQERKDGLAVEFLTSLRAHAFCSAYGNFLRASAKLQATEDRLSATLIQKQEACPAVFSSSASPKEPSRSRGDQESAPPGLFHVTNDFSLLTGRFLQQLRTEIATHEKSVKEWEGGLRSQLQEGVFGFPHQPLYISCKAANGQPGSDLSLRVFTIAPLLPLSTLSLWIELRERVPRSDQVLRVQPTVDTHLVPHSASHSSNSEEEEQIRTAVSSRGKLDISQTDMSFPYPLSGGSREARAFFHKRSVLLCGLRKHTDEENRGLQRCSVHFRVKRARVKPSFRGFQLTDPILPPSTVLSMVQLLETQQESTQAGNESENKQQAGNESEFPSAQSQMAGLSPAPVVSSSSELKIQDVPSLSALLEERGGTAVLLSRTEMEREESEKQQRSTQQSQGVIRRQGRFSVCGSVFSPDGRERLRRVGGLVAVLFEGAELKQVVKEAAFNTWKERQTTAAPDSLLSPEEKSAPLPKNPVGTSATEGWGRGMRKSVAALFGRISTTDDSPSAEAVKEQSEKKMEMETVKNPKNNNKVRGSVKALADLFGLEVSPVSPDGHAPGESTDASSDKEAAGYSPLPGGQQRQRRRKQTESSDDSMDSDSEGDGHLSSSVSSETSSSSLPSSGSALQTGPSSAASLTGSSVESETDDETDGVRTDEAESEGTTSDDAKCEEGVGKWEPKMEKKKQRPVTASSQKSLPAVGGGLLSPSATSENSIPLSLEEGRAMFPADPAPIWLTEGEKETKVSVPATLGVRKSISMFVSRPVFVSEHLSLEERRATRAAHEARHLPVCAAPDGTEVLAEAVALATGLQEGDASLGVVVRLLQEKFPSLLFDRLVLSLGDDIHVPALSTAVSGFPLNVGELDSLGAVPWYTVSSSVSGEGVFLAEKEKEDTQRVPVLCASLMPPERPPLLQSERGASNSGSSLL